jgi:hypothetical protein
VWWQGWHKPSQEPRANLNGIDADKLREAEQMPDKRVKLTVARHEAGIGLSSEARGSAVSNYHEPRVVGQDQFPVKYQATDEYRTQHMRWMPFQAANLVTLHSVANVVALPEDLYVSIRAKGKLLELEKVSAILKNWKGSPRHLH